MVSVKRGYYVSVISGSKFALVCGPMASHDEALAMVPVVKEDAMKVDPRAPFYAYGTCSVTETDEQIVLPIPNYNERYPQAVIGVEWVDVPARATGRALPVPIA